MSKVASKTNVADRSSREAKRRQTVDDILSAKADGVLTIKFNRTSKKNSVTSAMYDGLAGLFDMASQDPEVRVVLITGDEDVFSAGNDLGDFLINPPGSPDAAVWKFIRVLNEFPKPVVGAPCGVAVGIGTTLLLHCDLVYAGTNARFSLPFVNLGLCPEAGSSFLLPLLFGYQRAAEALMLGESFNADDALSYGLVNRVLPPAEVAQFALAQARKLVEKPSSSVTEIKRLLKFGRQDLVTKQIEAEANTFGKLVVGPAVKEAVRAFSEKRKPNFSGL